MIDNPWFYLAAVPAVLLTGISKGGFSGGIGLIAVPAMALVISPVQAAGIMLPILMVMDVIGVWAYRAKWDPTNLKYLMPGAAFGILLGALTAGLIDENLVRLIVGAIAVAFAVDRWRKHHDPATARGPDRVRGSFWGTIAGYTSFVAHAGAPPFQIYMLPQKPDRSIFVGTSIMFFWLVNLIKLPPYAMLGQLAPANLMTSLVLLPLAPIGMAIGIWAHKTIPEEPFFRIVYILIFVVGLKLIWDGLSYTLGL